MSYPQKKIIITGQNDAEGKIYVTGYEEVSPDIEDNISNKVNIDDDKIVEQVANIKSVFGSSRTDQAPTQIPIEAEAKAQPPTQPPTPDVTAPAPASASAPASAQEQGQSQAPINTEQFNAMPIPWRVDNYGNKENVSDYIKWIKKEIRNRYTSKYDNNELNNIVNEYNKLIQKLKDTRSITQEDLDSFFELTENLKKLRGGKTKKLRAFRKKTLRNQRKSKKRLGSRKNIR